MNEAAPPENEIRIRVEDETARALKLISLKSLLVRPSHKAVLFVTAADFLLLSRSRRATMSSSSRSMNMSAIVEAVSMFRE